MYVIIQKNYINLHHRYPDNYRGIRDEAVFARLDEDIGYDPKTGELHLPRGKMDGDDFVYVPIGCDSVPPSKTV